MYLLAFVWFNMRQIFQFFLDDYFLRFRNWVPLYSTCMASWFGMYNMACQSCWNKECSYVLKHFKRKIWLPHSKRLVSSDFIQREHILFLAFVV